MPKKIKFEVFFEEYDDISKLPAESQNLIDQAKKACTTAYSIYSGFSVGAAVLLANGQTVSGSNQENVSFPSGLCAERVAVFSAAAQFPKVSIKKLALTAVHQHLAKIEPVSPCGGCRQVLMEYELLQKAPIEIIMFGSSGKVMVAQSLDMLLPFRFSAKPNGKSI